MYIQNFNSVGRYSSNLLGVYLKCHSPNAVSHQNSRIKPSGTDTKVPRMHTCVVNGAPEYTQIHISPILVQHHEQWSNTTHRENIMLGNVLTDAFCWLRSIFPRRNQNRWVAFEYLCLRRRRHCSPQTPWSRRRCCATTTTRRKRTPRKTRERRRLVAVGRHWWWDRRNDCDGCSCFCCHFRRRYRSWSV